MRKSLKNLLTLLLALVFLLSAYMLVKHRMDEYSSRDSYSRALASTVGDEKNTEPFIPTTEETIPPVPETETPVQLVWVPAPLEEEDPCYQALLDMDLESLRQVNGDVVGWIRIPDTEVDYPLMQGADNDYYLGRTWEGKSNIAGSIFLEYLNSPQLTDFNTIVYGHNMKNGSMFAQILRYQTQEYWETHPYIYIRSDQGVYRYEVFSAYLADVDGFTYDLGFAGPEDQERFLTSALENSVFSCSVQPETTDRVLTLSTCSGGDYSTRWVVHARLKMVQQPSQ